MTEDYDILTRKEKADRFKPINLTTPPPKDDQQKIKPKHGGGSGQQIGKFYIKQLSNRKRKRSLGDEDLDILGASFGTNGDGVSLVDSREYTYDGGGGLR